MFEHNLDIRDCYLCPERAARQFDHKFDPFSDPRTAVSTLVSYHKPAENGEPRYLFAFVAGEQTLPNGKSGISLLDTTRACEVYRLPHTLPTAGNYDFGPLTAEQVNLLFDISAGHSALKFFAQQEKMQKIHSMPTSFRTQREEQLQAAQDLVCDSLVELGFSLQTSRSAAHLSL